MPWELIVLVPLLCVSVWMYRHDYGYQGWLEKYREMFQ